MKKIIYGFILIISIVLLTGCAIKEDDNKISIVATNFPGYDFARAIVGDTDYIEVSMLLTPGSDMHSYEPTPKDIKKIKNSSIFIYVGGESDSWIEDVLKDINPDKTRVIKMMDLVTLKEEEIVEGMESNGEEKEYDEHVWTSPVNAIQIIEQLRDIIVELDEKNRENYELNSDHYTNRIRDIDFLIRDIVNDSPKKEIIFGDRFPFRYLVDEYGIKYYAAFPGCAHETEASAKTIAFLIDKVKEDKINVIFQTELSNNHIADTIAGETGAMVMELHSCHNISKEDFDEGLTYVEIMNHNVDALREALRENL